MTEPSSPANAAPLDRFGEITAQPFDEAQKRAIEILATNKQGGLGHPARIWLQSPEFAVRAQKVGEFVRFDSGFSQRQSELAILVTVRHWGARYPWSVHRPAALKAGLDPQIVEAITAGTTPSFADPTEKIIHDFARTLLVEKQVSDALYRNATAMLGKKGVVELIGIIGYYSMISMTLNTFEVPPQED
jgi:4-carboxymuconolactone decarboxylase